MPSGSAFRATLTSLWFRLTVLAIVSLIFAEALILASGKAQEWTFYLTIPEVLFEVLVRITAAALVGLSASNATRTKLGLGRQTSLAPTILELAGVPRPEWMRGQSLVPWFNGAATGEENGLAFTQYLERNSIFNLSVTGRSV
jgi:hypothetical protein